MIPFHCQSVSFFGERTYFKKRFGERTFILNGISIIAIDTAQRHSTK
jgi:hypothetical protein